MDRALKQRLLGAVILTALLVILVPEWLDGAGHKSRYPSHIEVPAVPEFKPMPEPQPQAVAPAPVTAAAPESPPEPKSAPKPAPPAATGTAPAPAEKQPSIHAWALQVGSFNEQKNAQLMRDRMRAKGYAAYIHQQASGSKTRYKVRIGPELDRARVDKLKDEIQAKQKIKGLVVNHP